MTCIRTPTHTYKHVHTTNVQRQQLIRLGVPSLFIAVSLDEGPGPPMRSPYTDLTKLYATVGILVRCCNVSPLQKSYQVILGTFYLTCMWCYNTQYYRKADIFRGRNTDFIFTDTVKVATSLCSGSCELTEATSEKYPLNSVTHVHAQGIK